jgi:hypothetical protein
MPCRALITKVQVAFGSVGLIVVGYVDSCDQTVYNSPRLLEFYSVILTFQLRMLLYAASSEARLPFDCLGPMLSAG